MKEDTKLPSPPTSTLVEDLAFTSSKNEPTETPLEDIPIATIEVDSGAPKDCEPTKHQSHHFLGFLCDMRRAVIAVNIISIFLALIEIGLLAAAFAMYDQVLADEGLEDWIGHDVTKAILGFLLGSAMLSIMLFSMGIHGALKFRSCPVIAALVYHAGSAFLHAIALNFFSVLISGLFIYPHVIFVLEMRNGVMTPETYKNHKHGCCV